MGIGSSDAFCTVVKDGVAMGLESLDSIIAIQQTEFSRTLWLRLEDDGFRHIG